MSNYNEFDDPPRGAGLLSNIGAKAAFFIVLIALSFMIGVVWKLYVGGGGRAGQNVPIIRADTDPYKVTPDDPGGMKIPHKDSTIFSSAGRDDASRIENLLADEDNEEPMPRSQLFAGLNTEETVEDVSENTQDAIDTIIEDTSESVMPPPPEAIREGTITDPETKIIMDLKEALEVEGDAQQVEDEPQPQAQPQVEPKPTPSTKPASKPTSSPVTQESSTTSDLASDPYFVQLASVKTRDGAENEWKKFQAKYPSILSGFSYRVESAILGDKGTFYRIQAGPVSKDKATKACADIKKIDPNGCLLKKK